MRVDIAADLESLWHAHHRRLARYIAGRVDRDLVEDLLQDTYLRALAAMQRGNGYTGEPGHWLFRIAHRRVIDEYRRRSNKPPLVDLDAIAFDDAEDGGSRTAGETAIADDLSPHELAECSHTCRQVQHAISQLRDDQGYVVQRRMDGYEYTEIAAELGKSNGAAKQLNTRAFANLRTALQEAL